MVLEEIIMSNEVLFTSEGKLRMGGKNFLEHLTKYSKKVVLLGFKPNYAEELSFYVQNHSSDANLILNSNDELTYHIIKEEENLSASNSDNNINKNFINNNYSDYIFIGTNEERLNEAKEWGIEPIYFNVNIPKDNPANIISNPNNVNIKNQFLSFSTLKDIVRYISMK